MEHHCNVSLNALVSSVAPCVLNRTYGCATDGERGLHVWVEGGCRGAFKCDGQNVGICGEKGLSARARCSCAGNVTTRRSENHALRAESDRSILRPRHILPTEVIRMASSFARVTADNYSGADVDELCGVAARLENMSRTIQATELLPHAISAQRFRAYAGNASSLRSALIRRGCLTVPWPTKGGGAVDRAGDGTARGSAVGGSSRGVLTIKVLGGSMTDGRMNCHEAMHVKCEGALHQQQLAWPAQLERALSLSFPGCRVVVRNFARAASRSTLFLDEYARRSLVSNADDIIVADFSVNDVKGIPPNDTRTPRLIQAGMESLIRHVLWPNGQVLPHEPLYEPSAVAFDSSSDKPQQHGEASRVVNPKLQPVEHDEGALLLRPRQVLHLEAFSRDAISQGFHCAHSSASHLAVATHYAVPFLSFMQAICDGQATAERSRAPWQQLYPAGCGYLDMIGFDCKVHPGPSVHRLYAQLLTSYMLDQGAAAAQQLQSIRMAKNRPGSASAAAPSCGISSTRVTTASLATDSKHGVRANAPPFIAELAVLQGCPLALSSLDVSHSGCDGSSAASAPNDSLASYAQPRSQVRVRAAIGWHCYEDRPGKPGWIAEARVHAAGLRTSANATTTAVLNRLEVPMLVSTGKHGKVVIGYLRSYEGMSAARIRVVAPPQGGVGEAEVLAEVTLDGKWDSPTSQLDRAVIAITRRHPTSAAAKGATSSHAGSAAALLIVIVEQLPPRAHQSLSSGSSAKWKLLSLHSC